MPKTIKPLSNNEVKNAKPREKDYVLSDGKGLQLRVRQNGSKQWNFNYYHPVTKKRINMGLGTYPDLSLVNARKLAQDARELILFDIDPKEQRETVRREKLAQALIDNPPVEHPVIRTHPFTGRKLIYVNSLFTLKIKNLADEESEELLQFLFNHIKQKRFQCLGFY